MAGRQQVQERVCSPDGKWLAASGGEQVMLLWEADSRGARWWSRHLTQMTRQEMPVGVDRLIQRMETWEGWASEAGY